MAENRHRKVLWLDPYFQSARPTTQSLWRALPLLLEKGWQVEVWCLEHDPLPPGVEARRMPRLRFLRELEGFWFWFCVSWRLRWQRLRGQDEWAVVHSSGPDLSGADVMSLHFHNRTWLRLLRGEPSGSWKELLRLVLTAVSFVRETLSFRSRRWRVLLPVSEALAARVRPHLAADKTIHVLPNLLDESRYNFSVRERERAAMRSQLKAGDQDFLFIFVSTGHYRRKGLWTALEVLKECRKTLCEEKGLNLRFLVVGAGERVQKSLEPRLDAEAQDWREWVDLIPPVSDVERWYAAADAFFFPSLYETFSLVSLEASACGLPLLVTPFDGQEMYLKDGVNGCLLPWDVDGMKARVLHFLRTERHQLTAGPAAFVNAADYADVLDQTYRGLAA